MPMSFQASGRAALATTRLLSLQASDQRFAIGSPRTAGLSIPSIFVVGTTRIRVLSPGARITANPSAISTFRQGRGRLKACCIGRQRPLTTRQSAVLSATSKAAASPEPASPAPRRRRAKRIVLAKGLTRMLRFIPRSVVGALEPIEGAGRPRSPAERRIARGAIPAAIFRRDIAIRAKI